MAKIIIQADDGTEYERLTIVNDTTNGWGPQLQKAIPFIIDAVQKAILKDLGRDPRLY